MAAAREICVSDTDLIVAREVAECFIRSTEQKAHGPFRIALSGGTTPRQLYAQLTGPQCVGRVPWSRLEFYFGDERCVPPDHPESNFHLADEGLFRPLNIPLTQIVRMEGEDRHPEQAARRYEELLRQRFAIASPHWPAFDLILLGLGQDGHTASLFPGSSALQETVRAVVSSESPRGVRQRLTFTAPLINHALRVVFTVTGRDKAAAVRSVLEEETVDAGQYPAKLIQPMEGRCLWYLDRAAASQLTMPTQISK